MGKTTLKRGVNESNKNNSIYKELWIMFILILTEQKKNKETLLTHAVRHSSMCDTKLI